MELLYVWIENYGNIRRQGFNFTNDYDVKVNRVKENEFDVSINKKERVNIFRNGENGVIDIYGIIGKNGSGKTTIINAILSHKIRGFSVYKLEKVEGEKPFLVIYSDDLVICEYENQDLIPYNLKNSDNSWLEDKNGKEIESNEKQQSLAIYYDNIFNSYKPFKEINRTLYIKSKSIINEIKKGFYKIDISTNNEFFYIHQKNSQKYTSNEIKNSILLFQSKYLAYSYIKRPKWLFINNIETNENKTTYKKFNGFFIDKMIEIFIGKYLNGDKTRFENVIQDLKLEIMDYQEQTSDDSSNIFKCIIEKFDILADKGDKISTKILGFGQVLPPTDNELYKFEDFLNIIKEVKKLLNYLEQENIGIDKKNGLVIEFKNNTHIKKIEEFLTFLKNNSIGAHFFEYRFDVEYSSGERALITLLARFLSKKNEIESIENENVLILLDEPDILLHPEWQRKYILVLIRFFENIYENKRVKIILTSHSPFVASDLPRENVIMLDVYDARDEETKRDEEDPKHQKVGNCKVVNDKDIKTFGANIFDLYTDAFFVESSFGEFAKVKIKEVVRWLEYTEDKNTKERTYTNETEINKEQIEYILNSIGEPLVKNKLQKMYDEYRESKITDEENKKLLEKFKNLPLEKQLEIYKEYENKIGDK